MFFLVVNAGKYSLCTCTIYKWINHDKSGYSEPSNVLGDSKTPRKPLDLVFRPSVSGCAGWISPGTLGVPWHSFLTSLQVWKWPIAYGITLGKVLFHLFIVFSRMERTWRNLRAEMTIAHRPTGICDDRIIRFIRKTWIILNNVFSCENHTWPKSAKPVP